MNFIQTDKEPPIILGSTLQISCGELQLEVNATIADIEKKLTVKFLFEKNLNDSKSTVEQIWTHAKRISKFTSSRL